jgi:hypothetical protein
MVAVVTAVTAFTGVSLTLVFANGQDDAPKKIWLVLLSLLASLIVPAGVAAIFTGWWAVYGLVFGYLFFRRVFYRHLKPEDGNWRERWLVDRLALETVAVGVLIVLAVGVGVIGIGQALVYRAGSLVQLIGLVVTVGASMILVGRYAAFRMRRIYKAKRGDDSGEVIPAYLPGDIRVATIGWIIASIVLSGATFVGQMMAYSWFTGLLIIRRSSAGG